MHWILQQLQNIGIVPVIKIEQAKGAVPLARALQEGGIPCAEVTLRTPAALDAIAAIAAAMPEVLLGAGTVLTLQQVDDAIQAGAKFIVSPGFNPVVVRRCMEKEIPVIPGCIVPSDMEQAMELGLDVVKFFPAEQSGGIAFLKAVSAPYPQLHFMPTGGIHAGNVQSYLAFDKVLACGGSWMVGPDLVARENYGEISGLCQKALWAMLDFHLCHVGIHEKDASAAADAAAWFEQMFGFDTTEGSHSIFAGQGIEVMKSPCWGAMGHIAIGVSSVPRAKTYLAAKGCRFREETTKKNASGQDIAVYLQQEVCGFALHLVQHIR